MNFWSITNFIPQLLIVKRVIKSDHFWYLWTAKDQNFALLLGKLEAYSVFESMYLWLHITCITKESSQRRVLGHYMPQGRF